ncbi:hypothetical protein CEE37_11435 [candidate division LCP-89 bacterium B3_LCP]|uniref:Glycosyltransferase RgtA/B/C/D-like domain-containing protein n=1 Tax=candidate division LCP-89 bacterium B3_LCP TaxID=2012998 RepID=A0A532UVQ6_UNCL8|nr:MAG: hypothetical protein CEE37_11435 [candidate division LCP-89 bacterium B3_LCP]
MRLNWIRNYWSKLDDSTKRYLLILVLSALTLRLIYAFSVDLIPQDVNGIDLDAVEYDHLGWSIAQGHGAVDVFGGPTSYRFPGYLYFLGLIYFIFGHHHTVVLIFQALIGAFTPLFIYFSARYLLSERISRIAGLLAAVYPVFIYYVGWLMTENLFLFLLNLLILLTISLTATNSKKKLASIGLIIGLLGLTRGVGLPFFGIIPIYVFFKTHGNFGKKVIDALIIVTIAIVTLIPWTIRNYVTYDRWMLPSSEGGGVLWMSFYRINFQDYYNVEPAFTYLDEVGRDNAESEEFYQILLENNLFGLTGMRQIFKDYYPDEPLPQSEPEATERLGNKAMALLIEKPEIWMVKSFTQIFRFWHVLDERGRYVNGYAFILPFFLFGVWQLRRRFWEFLPLYLFPLMIYSVSVIFFADARFRMPFEGVFIIVGAFAVDRFLGLFKRVYIGYAIVVLFFMLNYFLRFHSMEIRLAIRAFASIIGLQVSDL